MKTMRPDRPTFGRHYAKSLINVTGLGVSGGRHCYASAADGTLRQSDRERRRWS